MSLSPVTNLYFLVWLWLWLRFRTLIQEILQFPRGPIVPVITTLMTFPGYDKLSGPIFIDI